MSEVYTELAKKLDKFPQGYPATESGIEIRILQKIFTPEEAAVALKINPMAESIEGIAERIGMSVEEARPVLDRMVDRGQIACINIGGRRRYVFVPFIIGIWEFQAGLLDRELAELFEEYSQELVGSIAGKQPALGRVVPVHRKIDAAVEVLRYEDLRQMLETAGTILLLPCICREKNDLLGRTCSHTLETCFAIGPDGGELENYRHVGRKLSREEALEVLDGCEREGLVHVTYNVKDRLHFICNCCSCCCEFMSNLGRSDAPYMLARSNFVARIDAQACSGCGICADERCPVAAITADGGEYTVLEERCIGCGVCSTACPEEAISLLRRPQEEQSEPVRNLRRWYMERSGRGGKDRRQPSNN